MPPKPPRASPSKPTEQEQAQAELTEFVGQATPQELRQIKAATVYPNYEPIQQYLDRTLAQTPAFNEGGMTFTGGPPGYTYRPQRYQAPTGTEAFRRAGDWLSQTAAPALQESPLGISLIAGRRVTYGDILETFNRSLAGRALQVLDLGAVAAERAQAFAFQISDDPRGTLENPGAAWGAGDILYEIGELGWESQPRLSAARDRIAAGESPQDVLAALLEANPDMAAQMMVADAAGHILIDPLNILLGYVRPVQLTQRVANLARWGTRWSDDVIDAARVAERTAMQALEAAEVAGRPADMAANLITDAIRASETLAEAERRALSPAQRFSIWITGGLPTSTETAGQFIDRATRLGLVGVIRGVASGDWRSLGRWGMLPWNLFRLTPQAMAGEVLENTQRYSQLLFGGARRFEDIEGVVARAASGMDTVLPHFFMTPGGRAMRGWIGLVQNDVQELGVFMRASAPMQAELDNLAGLLGRTSDDLVSDLVAGKGDDILESLRQASAQPTDLTRGLAQVYGRRIAEGLLTPETLRNMGRTFESMPFNFDTYRATILQRLWDHTARISTTLFGVEAQGWWARQARALKAVETLAFLRTNPGYMVRNFLNNELTSIFRGVFGQPFTTAEHVLEWWRKIGVVDPAIMRGIGAADIEAAALNASDRVSRAMSESAEIISDATRGPLTPVENIINRLREPIRHFDMGRYAQSMERWASARAFTSAYMQAQPYYFRAGVGFSRMPDALRTSLGDDLARQVEGVLPGIHNADDLRTGLLGNLNTSYGSFVEDVTQNLGVSEQRLTDVLGQEFVSRFYDEARPLMGAGNAEGIAALGQRYAREAQSHIDDLAQHTDVYERAFQALANGDGPAAVVRLRGEMGWMEHSTMEAHLGQLEREIPLIRAMTDEAAQRAAWSSLLMDADANWVRAQRWQENIGRGITQGANRAGIQLPDDIGQSLAEQNRSMREFFTFRNDSYRAAYSLEGPEREAALQRLIDDMDTRYQILIERTIATDARVDNAIGSLISDPNQRQIYDAARLQIRELRQQYMIDMRQAYRTAPPVLGGGHTEFFESVVQPMRRAYNEQAWALERQYVEAMRGNPAAVGELSPAMAQAQRATRRRQILDEAAHQVWPEGRPVIPPSAEGRIQEQLAQQELLDQAVQANPEWRAELQHLRVEEEVAVTRVGPAPSEAALGEAERSRLHALAGAPPGEAQVFRSGLGTIKFFEGSPNRPPVLVNIQARGIGEETLRSWIQESVVDRGFTRFETNWQTVGEHGGEEFFRRMEEQGLIRHVGEVPGTLEGRPGHLYDVVGVAPREARTAASLPDIRGLGIQDGVRPDAMGFHELWQEQGGTYLRQMERSAQDLSGRRPLRLSNLDPQTENALRGYIRQLEDELPGARMAALKQSEVRRDSALLNYGRRTEFDTYAGMVFPFSFWMTHSMFNWALWSLDRPGVLATWLRVRRLFDTVQQEQWVPQRMRGFRMPIRVPFAPNWLGPIFANPLAFGLPFDQWFRTAEDLGSLSQRSEARVERVIDVMLENGEIDQAQHDDAIRSRQGGIWDAASRQVTNGEDGWIDVFSFLASPHAPISWAINAARGRPFQPGPFLPATRSIRSVTAMLGIGPAGGVNIEAPVRRMLNLPEFDEWDEYRIDRQLAVMATEGYPVEIIERARLQRDGPIFEEAQRRAGQQYAVGGIGGLLGIPLMGFPPGEQEGRQLRQQFTEEILPALDRGDVDAYRDFVEEHPEIESWFAINRSPEERLQSFLVDIVWDQYNNLPDFNQREAVEQFGPMFEHYFLSRETRDYTSIPPEVLSGWARALGGDVPALQNLTPNPQVLELTPAPIANRIQDFYGIREGLHDWPAVRELQTEYFALSDSARRGFSASHPELTRYWDWRRDFLYRNPDLIPYLVEDPSTFRFPSAELYEQGVAEQPSLQWAEWYQVLGPNLAALVEDSIAGEDLPAAAEARLGEVADSLGIPREALLDRLATAIASQ